jgi:hypothetical protein
MKKNKRIIKDASKWQDMDGNTNIEKQINSYLTCIFISKHNIPSDECLSETKAILEEANEGKEGLLDRIERYLNHQFMYPDSVIKRDCYIQAREVISLLGV